MRHGKGARQVNLCGLRCKRSADARPSVAGLIELAGLVGVWMLASMSWLASLPGCWGAVKIPSRYVASLNYRTDLRVAAVEIEDGVY